MALWACLGSCSGHERLVLGNQPLQPYTFGAPQEVTELSSKEATGNPTLTADKLDIYLTRKEGPDRLIWHATRSSPDLPFDPPVKLNELRISGVDDTSPAISADGLTLWFGSNRAGGLGDMDIWVSTRTRESPLWSAPVNLVALNSKKKDIPRPLGQYGTVMPMSSDRGPSKLYQIYLTTLVGENVFSTPILVSELTPANHSHADAFLTNDGLTLIYSQGPADGPMDLYMAWRKSLSDRFEPSRPLDAINTKKYDEYDPWLSADGKEFYFASTRSGRSLIYRSSVSGDLSRDLPSPIDAGMGN